MFTKTLSFALLLLAVSAQEFDSDIDISSAVSVEDVQKEIASSGKPGVVFVTQPWCGACKGLKKSINGDSEFKDMLKKFVVVHASGDDASQWQGEGQADGYIPRVYFLKSNGKMIDVPAPNEQYKYFFPSSAAVKSGLETLLEAENSAGSVEL